MKGLIEGIHKNARYKFLKSENKYFLIDLQENILSYFFPMINLFFSKKCKVLSEREYLKINQYINKSKTSSKAYLSSTSGLGVLIAVLLRPIMKESYINVNPLLVMSLLFLIVLAILFTHLHLRKKRELYMVVKSSETLQIKIFPNIKQMLAFFILYFICLFAILFCCYALLIPGLQNVMIFIINIFMLVFLSCMNILSIPNGAVTYKIK